MNFFFSNALQNDSETAISSQMATDNKGALYTVTI